MKNTLKTLSVLLSYPGPNHRVLYENKGELEEILLGEDPEIAPLIIEFMDRVPYNELDERFVALFEMPPKCPLYAHEHMTRQKESEIGNFLLEVKIFYKAKGLDVDASRELPDYLPVMLEYLSNLVPGDEGLASSFVRKYMDPWLKKWVECVKKEDGDFALLAEAVLKAVSRVGETTARKGPSTRP